MKLVDVILNKETYVIDLVYKHADANTLTIVICDLQTDIPYYKWTEHFKNYSSIWIYPLHNTLMELVRNNSKFPGFVCKIYRNGLLEQVECIHTSTEDFKYRTYITDGIDCVGNSYIDFFYGDLCKGINFENTVIDAGANVGLFTWLAKERGAGRVYSIEPDQRAFFYLDKNFKNDDSVVLINKALTTTLDGTIFYYCIESTVGNSQYKNSDNFVEDYVETINLDTLLNIEREVNLLKLDIEGTEFDVFDKLKPEQFKQVNQFFIEFHNISTPIKNKLLENNFKVEYRNSDESSIAGFIYAYKEKRQP